MKTHLRGLGNLSPETDVGGARTGPVAALRFMKKSNPSPKQAFVEKPKNKILVTPSNYIPALASEATLEEENLVA